MPEIQDNTPVHSQGFGAAENSDDTRQAQHGFANDTPTDVNMNAIIARSQALTVDMAGKGFVGAQERRTLFADRDLKV